MDPKCLFLGRQAWQAAPTNPFWASPVGSLQLLPVPAPAAGPGLPVPSEAVGGIAVAPGGRLFWTDPDTDAVWVHHEGVTQALTSLGGSPYFKNPTVICAGPRGALCVTDWNGGRILLFALDHYQLIDVWDGFARPYAMAVSPDGSRLYVSEAGRKGGIAVLHPATGRRIGELGADVLIKPRGLCFTPDGHLYVADKGLDGVAVFGPDGELRQIFRIGGKPTAIAVGPDFFWVGSSARPGIDQFLLDGTPAGSAPGYTSRTRTLLYTPHDQRLLVAPKRAPGPVVMAAGGAYTAAGQLITAPLDSQIHDCQWHKLVLGASVPEGARLTVEARTAPVPLGPGDLADGEWSEPVSFTGSPRGELDMAVLCPPGRYLWLRLTLEGSGRATPMLEWIRAYAPRSTYAEYLPAVFRSDPVSADFLDRFMLLFEHFLGDWENKTDHMADLFSPEATPYLPELASWLDFRLNRRQPEGEQRQWLARAMELHRERGTVDGLRELLRMYTDPTKPPVIVEGFTRRGFTRLGEEGPGVRLGADTVLPGAPEGELVLGADQVGNGDLLPGDLAPLATGAHQFAVYAYQYPGQPADEMAVLESVLRAERPVQTQHYLCEVRPAMRVGAQSIVGVDTVLAGGFPPARLDGAETPDALPGQFPQPVPTQTELQPNAPVLNLGNRLR